MSQLESLIRQQETELALLSELQGAKEEAAGKAKEMSEYITKLDERNNETEVTLKEFQTKVRIVVYIE